MTSRGINKLVYYVDEYVDGVVIGDRDRGMNSTKYLPIHIGNVGFNY